jgi:predicted MFS family arabinose efflux permease
VGQLFQNDDLSTASASRSVLYGIGSVIGPPVAGLAFDHWGRYSLPVVLSTVCAGLLVSCLLLRRQGRSGKA